MSSNSKFCKISIFIRRLCKISIFIFKIIREKVSLLQKFLYYKHCVFMCYCTSALLKHTLYANKNTCYTGSVSHVVKYSCILSVSKRGTIAVIIIVFCVRFLLLVVKSHTIKLLHLKKNLSLNQ